MLACVLLGVATWLIPTTAFAQPESRPPDKEQLEILVSANEHTLWTSVVSATQSRIFHRAAGGEFSRGRLISRPIKAQVVLNQDLLVFFEDGAPYRYSPDPIAKSVVEKILPERTIPLAMIGDDKLVYAIVPTKITPEMPVYKVGEGDEIEHPGLATGSPYCLVVFDGGSWSVMAAMPEML